MKVPFLNLKIQYEKIMKEINAEIEDVFKNTAFIGGEKVKVFEENIAEYVGTKYAVGCNSGTDALVLALRACGVLPGDEVITTAFSFFATAEAIAAVGAIPVFIDINESDYNIDVSKISEAITDKTKAILPVHIFGAPCDMDAIMSIAKKHGLRVIEDDAQAIGSMYKGRKAGSLGDVGCFSFYPTKNLGGAGDGGMVTTNDEELATIMRALREHGSGLNGAKALEYLGGAVEDTIVNEKVTDLYNPYKYYNYLIGYNSRLDAIQASVLNIKLKYLDGYNERRRQIAKMYIDNLTKKVVTPVYSENVVSCFHQFVIATDCKYELCDYLNKNEVGCGTFYPVPLHEQKAFNSDNCKNYNIDLPVSQMMSEKTVCLPIFPEMSDDMVEYVIECVNKYFE